MRRMSIAVAVVMAGCSDDLGSGEQALGKAETSNSDGIEAQEREGVWMFFHAPRDHDNALHSGVPEVRGQCLFVGDAVVVWHEQRMDEAEHALGLALANEESTVTLGGGGISLDEGDIPIPEPIAEHCETREVWFGSPE